MKKICHVSSAHERYDVRILQRECVSLADSGFTTYFVVNDDLPDEEYQGVFIKTTGYKAGGRAKRITVGIKKVYKKALEIDADIYHLHDPELLVIAQRLKKKNKYVIFDSHENYYEQIRNKDYLPKAIRESVAQIYYKYETSVVKKLDGVVVPTKFAGVNIFEERACRTAIVNNVPKLEEIPEIENENWHREGICYTGSLTYNRGILQLAQAAKLANVPLTLAGKFSPDTFREEIVKSNLGENVVYKGSVTRSEVYKLYEQCAIGMSTLLNVGQYSKMGNFPTKVYEYMAMKMPVLLSDFPYNRKMVEKYNMGLTVDPSNPEQIAEKIRYLIDNPEDARKMGENGRKLIMEKLNWSIEEKKLQVLYSEILSEKE